MNPTPFTQNSGYPHFILYLAVGLLCLGILLYALRKRRKQLSRRNVMARYPLTRKSRPGGLVCLRDPKDPAFGTIISVRRDD